MGIFICPWKDKVMPASDRAVMMVTAGANHQVKVLEFAMFFDGESATDKPSSVDLVRATSAGTSSAFTPLKYNDSDADSVDFVGAHNFTGNPTEGDVPYPLRIHPQTGIILPFVRDFIIGAGDRLMVIVRNTSPVPTVSGWLLLEE